MATGVRRKKSGPFFEKYKGMSVSGGKKVLDYPTGKILLLTNVNNKMLLTLYPNSHMEWNTVFCFFFFVIVCFDL